MRMYQFMLICLLPACLSAMEQRDTYLEKEKNTFPQELDYKEQRIDAQDTSKIRIGARIGTGVALGMTEGIVMPIIGMFAGDNLGNSSAQETIPVLGTSLSSYALSQISRFICHHDMYFHVSHIISSWGSCSGMFFYLGNMTKPHKNLLLLTLYLHCLAGTIPSMQYFLEKYCFPESVSSQQRITSTT